MFQRVDLRKVAPLDGFCSYFQYKKSPPILYYVSGVCNARGSCLNPTKLVKNLFFLVFGYFGPSRLRTLVLIATAKLQFMKLIFVLLALVVQRGLGFGLGGSTLVRPGRQSQSTSMDRERVSSGARSMTMMPIGIPKVAYKMPGSRGGEWVDIYQRLTRERIIFMGSEIDDEMANQIIGVLLVRCSLWRSIIPLCPS